MKRLFLLLLIVPLFISCGSDDDDNFPNPITPKNYLPKSILRADSTKMTFDYDSKNRLTKVVSTSNPNERVDTYEITYIKNNRVSLIKYHYSYNVFVGPVDSLSQTRFEGDLFYKPAYVSNNEIIILCGIGNMNNVYQEIKLLLNNQGRIIEEVGTGPGPALNNSYDIKYEYDTRGNQIRKYNRDASYEFKYDDQVGMMKNGNTPFWVLHLIGGLFLDTVTTNNRIYYKFENENTPKDMTIINTEYTYNKNNMPVTIIDKDSKNYDTIIYY